MLEGLEIAEIKFSYTKSRNEVFRIDSGYFKKEFIRDEYLIRKNAFIKLKDLNIEIKSFGAYSLNNEVIYISDGIPFIRGINMKKGRIDFSDMIYIDKYSNEILKKSEIRPNMVLLSMSGTIGEIAIASPMWKYPINSNQDIAKIDTKGKLSPHFLYCFLRSKFGQNFFQREARGSVQQHVFLSQIELLELPDLSKSFIECLQNTINLSDERYFRSIELFSQAESLLLHSLGLQNFEPSAEKVNIKGFKQSFLATGRLDAEYYQKKYEDIIERIMSQTHDVLSRLVSIKKSIEPGSDQYDDKGLPFLRVADYNKYDFSEPDKKLSWRYCTENAKLIEDLKPKKDTILFSKDGTVGIAYQVRENLNLITSGAILHLTVNNKKAVFPEYLTLVLDSIVGQMQADRDTGGSIIQHWRPDEIKKMLIPIASIDVQQKIKEFADESHKLMKQSESLLETAKRAVEIAIEQNEAAAMEWINSSSFE